MNNENKQYLTVKEVKNYLNISTATAYELTHQSDFPVCRFGANIRILRDAFLAWVAKCTFIPNCLRAS